MELHIEVISSEMIKPSSPTPPHLKYFNLSLLDQFFQFTFVPHILFYEPSTSTPKHDYMATISKLKRSLSKSLALYYPFAGRLIVDASTIECNDDGVSFVVARAHGCSMVNFLEAPNRVDLVGRFLSEVIYDHNSTSDSNNNSNVDKNGGDTEHVFVSPPLNVTKLVPMTIQVTIFDCGGFVIGSQWLHKVCDAASWGHFLKSWAAFSAERNEDVVFPDFETAISVFPPHNPTPPPAGRKARTLVPMDDDEADKAVDGVCVVKAFDFSPDAIHALQDRSSSENVPNPTRIEAVSGFIWKHAMSASASARASSPVSSTLGPSALTHAVNMRSRFRKPLPPTTFGNVLVDTIAHYDDPLAGETESNLEDLVYRLRKSLSKAKDAEFLGRFIGQGGGDVLCKYKEKLAETLRDSNVTTYKFTSWAGLDMNTDFGFGIPVWAAFTGGRLNLSFKNLVILMDTFKGGIEAWMILEEQEMVILENDQDFLEFATSSTIIDHEETIEFAET